MKESELLIPNTIDRPKKMLMWDADVFMLGVIGLGVGIVTRNLVIYPPIFFFLAWRWGKFKSGKHPWFFMHALLWYMPFNRRNPCIPSSGAREFIR